MNPHAHTSVLVRWLLRLLFVVALSTATACASFGGQDQPNQQNAQEEGEEGEEGEGQESEEGEGEGGDD